MIVVLRILVVIVVVVLIAVLIVIYASNATGVKEPRLATLWAERAQCAVECHMQDMQEYHGGQSDE